MKKRSPGKGRKFFNKWLVRLIVTALLLTMLPVLALRWIPPPTTSFMLHARLGALSAHGPCSKVHYQWKPLKQLSRDMVVAVIASEDQLFSQHWGFDFKSIGSVLEGGEKRGASTISQQVAKNLFLWPGRSWVRKGLEAYLTVGIEFAWDKQRIMEVYLNVAQFGPCTFGVGAAAKQYFSRQASSLSLHESALLATVLPNPYQSNPGNPSSYMLERAQWIESQAVQLGGTTYLEAW